jgi:type VI secretion system secreted protein Hcp
MQSIRTSIKPRAALCTFGLAGILSSGAASAFALDTFMKIDGIPGESADIQHMGDIILTSYSQSFGARNCSRVVVNKSLDRASPALISRAAANTWIPQVIISLRKAGEGQRDFYTATLDSVLIERIDLGDQNNALTEQIVLRPRSIRIEYRPQDAKGELLPAIVSTIACN